jgi:citrate lyase subunit beta/citryl-CoA lyase
VLFLPGSNPRALSKAKTIPADVLVLDLEDAVSPDAKEAARTLVADAVAGRGYGQREILVRINALDTPWAAGDIAAVVPSRPDGILVPKVSRSEDIRRIRAALKAVSAQPSTAVWAMMETPLSILNAGAIAATASDEGAPLAGFLIGTNDLSAETRIRPGGDRLPMLSWLSTCVLAARAFDLAVIDGVYNDYNDAAGFKAECEQGRLLGMDGKSLIHPNQVAACNEVFSPSAEEINWARAVVAAFDKPENAGKGAIALNGRMIERLHMRIAQRMIATARARSG